MFARPTTGERHAGPRSAHSRGILCDPREDDPRSPYLYRMQNRLSRRLIVASIIAVGWHSASPLPYTPAFLTPSKITRFLASPRGRVSEVISARAHVRPTVSSGPSQSLAEIAHSRGRDAARITRVLRMHARIGRSRHVVAHCHPTGGCTAHASKHHACTHAPHGRTPMNARRAFFA